MIGELRSAVDREDWGRLKELSGEIGPAELVYLQDLKRPDILAFCMHHYRCSKFHVNELLEPAKKLISKTENGLLILSQFSEEYHDREYPYVGVHLFDGEWRERAQDSLDNGWRYREPIDPGDTHAIEDARINEVALQGYYGAFSEFEIKLDEAETLYPSFLIEAYVGEAKYLAFTKMGVSTGHLYQR